jgi:hypothetical protein
MENNECSLMWPEQYELCQQKLEWQREINARNLSWDENQIKSQKSKAARCGK